MGGGGGFRFSCSGYPKVSTNNLRLHIRYNLAYKTCDFNREELFIVILTKTQPRIVCSVTHVSSARFLDLLDRHNLFTVSLFACLILTSALVTSDTELHKAMNFRSF